MDRTNAKVLLIEDDLLVRDGVASSLRAQGLDVRAEADGNRLDSILEQFRPDLAVIDVNLRTGPDGFALAEAIRNWSSVPVIFVTARDTIDDRLRGFGVGADDYLVKPFSIHELNARVRVVLRRASGDGGRTLCAGDVTIDVRTRTVVRSGSAVSLTPTEFDLLVALTRDPGRPRTKTELLQMVWGFDENSPHLVEVQISGLRRKLEEHGPSMILTCRDGACVVER